MPIVKMPDGQNVRFPDDMPAAEIKSFIEKQFPETVEVPYDLGDVGMAAVRGIPIAGGLVERYSSPESKAEYEKFDTAHPYISGAAGIAGGMAALAPLGLSATGARLLGLGGRTLMNQIGRSALSGAAMTGADVSIRGGDPGVGAVVGGVMGAAAPAAGRLAAGALSAPINAIRGAVNPGRQAQRALASAAREGHFADRAMTEAEFGAARAAGQPAMVMDVAGEPGRALARSAANVSPVARAELEHVLQGRQRGAGDRIIDWMSSRFNFPSAHATEQALERAANAANAQYQPLFRANPQKLWDEGFEQLLQSKTAQDAVNRAQTIGANQAARGGFNPVRNAFHVDPATGRFTLKNSIKVGTRDVEPNPTLEFWNEVKKQLDAAGRMDGGAAQEARILRDRLDELVPEYGAVRQQRFRLFQAENAFEAGQNFVRQPFQNEQTAHALSRMTEQERRLFQDGFISRYLDELRRVPDRFNVLNRISQSREAQGKLRLVLGEQRFRELDAFLHVESIMQLANEAVRGNSTTARQLAELGLAGGTGLALSGGDMTNPATVVNAALVYGALRGRAAINRGVAERIARMLVSDDPATVARAMRTLSGPAYLSHLRNARAGLADIATDLGIRAASPQAAEAVQ